MKGKWSYSFGKDGSFGFGFGVWRVHYIPDIIWTIALGPLTVYYIKYGSYNSEK